MRILYLLPSLSSGGAERQVSLLADKVNEEGLDVHLAYMKKGPERPDLLNGIHLHEIRSNSNYDPRILFKVANLISRLKPQIVQSTIVYMDILGGIACRLTKCPWILREANNEIAAQKRGNKEKIRRFVARWATHIVANSQSGFFYWKKQIPQASCSIIYNGLPDLFFKNGNDFATNTNRRYNLLFVGRLEPQKNVEFLLGAFKDIVINFPDLKLRICGEGSLKSKIEQLAFVYGIKDNVDMMGYLPREKIKKLLEESRLLINPSLYEGCPNIVLEAMACNCPVLLSDIAPHKELLDESSAFYFKLGSKNALVEKIIKALNNAQLCNIYSQKSNKIARKFSVHAMTKNYIELYNSII